MTINKQITKSIEKKIKHKIGLTSWNLKVGVDYDT